MPLLFNTWPSAPLIIPLTALVVIAVAIVLLIAHLLRKLVGCPHRKSKYPFEGQDLEKLGKRSVLPTSPYTIDPSSTASSSSIYFLKGHNTATGAALLYPAISGGSPGNRHPSAPSRSPSARGGGGGGGRGGPDDSFEGGSSLDQVDGDQGVIETLLGGGDNHDMSSTPLGGRHSESMMHHALISGRSSSATPSPLGAGGYETLDERTTFRAEVSYHRSEHTSEQYIGGGSGSGNGDGSNSGGAYSNAAIAAEQHYESDV